MHGYVSNFEKKRKKQRQNCFWCVCVCVSWTFCSGHLVGTCARLISRAQCVLVSVISRKFVHACRGCGGLLRLCFCTAVYAFTGCGSVADVVDTWTLCYTTCLKGREGGCIHTLVKRMHNSAEIEARYMLPATPSVLGTIQAQTNRAGTSCMHFATAIVMSGITLLSLMYQVLEAARDVCR